MSVVKGPNTFANVIFVLSSFSLLLHCKNRLNRVFNPFNTQALAKHWVKGSNALSFFAPNINIVRDIRWGRAQETYDRERGREKGLRENRKRRERRGGGGGE